MIIQVRVFPNSKKAEVVKDGKNFRIKIDARAQDGKANERLIEILADYFKVKKSAVSIVRGFKNRDKIVDVDA